jgi:hypothetical protein
LPYSRLVVPWPETDGESRRELKLTNRRLHVQLEADHLPYQ